MPMNINGRDVLAELNQLRADINALTELVGASSQAAIKSSSTFMDQIDWLVARAELIATLQQFLLASAPPDLRTAAIAAAQIRGEQLSEQGPKGVAEAFARQIAGIVATQR